MTGIDLAVPAFWSRCNGDADLRELVGTDGGEIRLGAEWPNDNLTASDYPRGSLTALDQPVGTGAFRVRITVDWWVSVQAPDPDVTLGQIEARMLELFAGKRWQHEGRWFSSTLQAGRMVPQQRARRAARRTREFTITAQH